MKKNRFIKILVFLFTFSLLSLSIIVPTKAMAFDNLGDGQAQYQFNQREAIKMVYALYRSNGADTIIRDDLTQAEIVSVHKRVETLPSGPIKTQLRVLVTIANNQLYAKENVYALFIDKTHTAVKPNINLNDIKKLRMMVKNLLQNELAIKKQLTSLLDKAASLLP